MRLLFMLTTILIIQQSSLCQDTINQQSKKPDTAKILTNTPPTKNEIQTQDSLPPIESMPTLISFVKATYPDSLIFKGIEGAVDFDLVISDKGSVDSVYIVKGLHPILDSSACKAVQQFTFTPAISQKKPIPVLLRYQYRFTLKDALKPVAAIKNLWGDVLEKGSRMQIARALIVVSFEDTLPPKNRNKKYKGVDKTPQGIPLKMYLDKIGTTPGQKLEDGKLVTSTDSLGNYAFSSLPNGFLKIKIIATGYRLFFSKVEVKAGKIEKARFWLERDSYNDNEVVVYGVVENTEVQSYDISQKEIKRIPGFDGEALKVLQALPGVSRSSFYGNELIVRGNENVNSKFFIDGIETPALYHPLSYDFMEYRSIIDGNILNSLTLLPGGWGTRYGNAIGGIIDMTTRTAKQDNKWHAMLDVNIKGCDIVYETPLWKNASLIGSFRGNYFFNIVGFVQRYTTGEPYPSTQDFWDYSLRFDWKISQAHHIFLSTIGAVDTSFKKDFYWQEGVKQDTSKNAVEFGKRLSLGILGWDWTISPQWTNMLRYGIRPTSLNSTINNEYNYIPDEKSKSVSNSLRDELQYTYNKKLGITVGIDIQHEPYNKIQPWNYNDTTYYDSQKITLGHYSGYLSAEIKPLDKLTLSPGLRYDFYPELSSYHGTWLPEFWNYNEKSINNHTRFSGDMSFRLSSKYELNTKHSFTASFGNYNQCPDSTIINSFGGMPAYKCITEKASQFTLDHQWKLSDLLTLNSAGYFTYQWDKPRYATAQELIDSNYTFMFSDGKARMEGLEFLLRREQDKYFSGWISYSLAYSERYNFETSKWVEYDYNVLNNLQLVANWFFSGNVTIGIRAQYTEGYPYTPWNMIYYDATNFQYVPTEGATNSKRLSPYYGLDLRLEKKWIFNAGVLTTYIEFERIIHWLQFVKDKNGNPIYSPGEINQYNYDFSQLQSIPMLPWISVGLTWEF